ncbi:MAG TPA: PhoH family protein [Candidatus Hydrogenedentes bacterium]|nr:PhoH family protein [Candidatus Hydrogenedentota bacterium]
MNEQHHARGADVPAGKSVQEYAHTLTHEFELHSQEEALRLLGFNGELRRRLQDQAGVRIVDRGTRVVIIGEETDAAVAGIALQGILDAVRMGHTPTVDDVDIAVSVARDREQRALGRMLAERPAAIRADVNIRPRTRGQHRYLEAIHRHDITLAVGPAGTGKTFLAMAAAVSALLNREVKRLVLTRPAVEAGERLGFLPGDLEQKVNPYLRPLYDALFVLLDMERARRLMEQQSIEVAPLAFMRGRTLDHAFIILDEAQNTTVDQMLMFLTPVFWMPESLPARAQYILWNPFAQMLELLRRPLMGGVADMHNWIGILGWTALSLLAAMVLFTKYRRRVVYWL